MANSIQQEVDPVLDLLGRMESQISSMEASRPELRPDSDSPEFRLLRDELAQAEQRGATQLALFTEALASLRTQIPELAQDAITSRFQDLEEGFYRQIQEIQQRAIDSFVQSAQARVGTRIAGLETILAEQSTAIAEMRESCVKSDRNVDRLLQGVNRLTAELMRLSTLAGTPIVTRRAAQLNLAPAPNFVPPRDLPPEQAGEPFRPKKNNSLPVLWISALAVLILAILAFAGFRMFRSQPPVAAPVAAAAGNPLDLQLKEAADFTAEKNYAKAENVYRAILKQFPENRAAIKELASVLFKQQRYEDAATVLKSLPPEN